MSRQGGAGREQDVLRVRRELAAIQRTIDTLGISGGTVNSVTEGDGIVITGAAADPIISVDLATNSGLQFTSGELEANFGTTANTISEGDHTHALSDLSDVSTDEAAAFNGAASPTGSNVFATINDIPGGRFSIAGIPEEEATSFFEIGSIYDTKLTFKFYVAVIATYTFHANYRLKSTSNAADRRALARLKSNSGAFVLAEQNRRNTAFGYVNASEQAGGTLAVGWHTCEVQIKNQHPSETAFIQGVFITFGLS